MLDELGRISEDARSAAEELVGVVVELHAPGLARVLGIVEDIAGEEGLGRLSDDPLVSGLLVLHGLHPVDVDTRIEAALDRVRPVMGAHAGNVEYLGVDDHAVAHLRLDGTCHGCPSSTATMKGMIEAALADAAPELAGLEVEGLVPAGATHAATNDAAAGVPVAAPSLKSRERPTGNGTARDHQHRRFAGSACQLCGGSLGEGHGHAVDTDTRYLACVCTACSIVLRAEGSSRGRFKAVGDRVVSDPTLALSDQQWESLGIPVSTVFFFDNSSLGRVVAFYPGPAGATESLLALDTWAEMVEAAPLLRGLVPDTEALLARHSADANEAFVVPIDACYQLTGLLRSHWRGFDGGQQAWAAIDDFFSHLRSRAADFNYSPGASSEGSFVG